MISYEIEFNDKSLIKKGDKVVGIRAFLVGTENGVEVKEPLAIDDDFGAVSMSTAEWTALLSERNEFPLAKKRIEHQLVLPSGMQKESPSGLKRVEVSEDGRR